MNRKTTNIFAWIAFAATVALLAAAFGYGFCSTNDGRSSKGSHAVIASLMSGSVSAIIDGFGYAVPSTREELLGRLQAIAGEAPGEYGVYIVELNTGEGFGFNEERRFEAASTIKVPILVKLFSEIERGNVSRDQVMTYTWADSEEGSGSIQNTGPGSQWTVAELAEKMMRESDNVAKNIFFRLLGYSEIEAFANSPGVEFSVYYNQTTARDMAELLRLIYTHGIVSAGLSEEMLGLMTGSLYEERIPRYLGDVPVAHKVGTMGDAVSDVGIVLLEGNPFIICVYSDETGSVAAAEEAIGRMAAQVYYYELKRLRQAAVPPAS